MTDRPDENDGDGTSPPHADEEADHCLCDLPPLAEEEETYDQDLPAATGGVSTD